MEVRKPNPNRWSWEVAENDIAAFVHASPEKARSGQRSTDRHVDNTCESQVQSGVVCQHVSRALTVSAGVLVRAGL